MADEAFPAVRDLIDPVALVEDLCDARVKHRAATDVRLAPCPFCSSKTGFSVNPQTKTFFCHHAGCGAKGDVFTFVERLRGLGPRQALEFLAERVGYELPKVRRVEDDELARILAIAQEVKRAAIEHYEAQLWARRDEEFTYMKDGADRTAMVLGYQTDVRGHSEEVLRRLRVGWADGKLLEALKTRFGGHPDRKLAFAGIVASGLVKRDERGLYDLFRSGGYVYPVLDGERIVTMTAKYPDERVANYQVPRTVEVNEREIDVWGAPCFFLNHNALSSDDLVLVEGEDDLISVMDVGGHPAVCGLRGTPKKEQLPLLAERRRGKRTYLAFDADEAGRDITSSVAESLAGEHYDVRVVSWGTASEGDTS